jgi:preprotein translocase subunit SecY
VFQTLKNAWKVPELKSKLLFTLLIVVLYRLGANIPVPWVSADVLTQFKELTAGSIFQYMNLLSGEAFGRATLFALSVSPYITASIVIQLLTIAIPALEKLAKNGEEGKKKLTAITRYCTVALALVTAWGYSAYLKSTGMLTNDSVFAQIVIIACYCAGASLIMWLAEKINEKGIGNGISIILFANIIASVPSMVSSLWYMLFKYSEDGLTRSLSVFGLIMAILTVVGLAAIIVLVVWFTNSERRIPIQYAKRVVGRKMYGGQSSNLPISLNMNGVMPIIFASSIVSLPATIAAFFPNSKFWTGVLNVFNYTSPLYLVLYIILIFAFAFFYVMISFNPVEVANNIKNNGGAVPGIRTGRPTAEYISKVLNRVTLLGALFLAFIAGFPILVNMIIMAIDSTNTAFTAFAFGGSSMLIVVGVALETFRDIEAQMTMRNYKGFLD